jgi:hypothetical protein
MMRCWFQRDWARQPFGTYKTSIPNVTIFRPLLLPPFIQVSFTMLLNLVLASIALSAHLSAFASANTVTARNWNNAPSKSWEDDNQQWDQPSYDGSKSKGQRKGQDAHQGKKAPSKT